MNISPLRKLGQLFRPRDILHDTAQSVIGVHWAYLGIAFLLAVFLWYTVTVRDKVDSWMDVRLEFKGTPSNLIIRDGLVNKVSVRLRAASGLTRSISSRSISVALDLSHITKGTTVMQITPEMLSLPSAFHVMEISPQSIQIVADSIETRTVPFESFIVEAPPGDFFVESVRFSPPAVKVRGPETLVAGLKSIRIPLSLGNVTRSGTAALTAVVPVPSSTTVEPAQVNVEVDVEVRTKTVRLTREVVLALPEEGRTVKMNPARVTVTVDIPESQAGNAETLARVIATVSLPPSAHGGPQKLPVNVLLPEMSALKSVSPKEVTVTVTEK